MMHRAQYGRGLLWSGLGLAGILLLSLPAAPPAPRPAAPPALAPRPAPVDRVALASPRYVPAPTEHVLDEDAERRNKANRKAWIAEKHRAPPGVDYKAIERENGLRQLARRVALRRAPPAVEPVARWVERGSDNQAGRMHAARLNPDRDTLVAGSSLGGVWVGSPEGTDWEPVGDNLYGGAHQLEVLRPDAESDPDILLVATDGGLVHRSVDGGSTWDEVAGVGSPSGIRRMLKLEDGSELVYLVASDSAGTALFRSQDLGASFEEIYDLGSFSGDVWAPRDGGDTLYLAGPGGVLFVSEDLGDSWTAAGSFGAGSSRAELSGSEAGAPRLWAVVDGARLMRSDDAGASFANLGYIGDDYWAALNASVVDADLFAYGGVELHATHNGGVSFSKVNNWWDYYGDPSSLLHADMMGIEVQLDDRGEEVWYICTDGGLYRSQDGLLGVENLSLQGLRVSQYYGTLTSSADPTHVAAGAQDQGYQLTNDVEQDDGIYELGQAVSGDYGHLTSSDGSHEVVYSVYPGFILAQVGETAPSLYYLDFPSGETYVPWLPPIVADPTDETIFYFPATKLYRYTFNKRRGTATYAQWSDQDFSSDGYEYLSKVTFSPLDADRVFAATSYGRFFSSRDHGVTWEESASLVADDNWYYGQAAVASHNDVDLVYVAGSGYGVPAVFRSQDGGESFRPWGQGLPSTLVYSLCEAPDDSGRMLAGTESSVYLRGPDDDAWVDITNNDAPITTYWSCEALTEENTVRFGTYGRGMWDYQLDAEGTGCFPVQDYDGDGVDCQSDCDDQDAAILPGAVELCDDGIDQDCDGADTPCADPGEGEGEPGTAGEGEGEGGNPETGKPGKPEGCACAAGDGRGGAGLLGLALALVAARRRRP